MTEYEMPEVEILDSTDNEYRSKKSNEILRRVDRLKQAYHAPLNLTQRFIFLGAGAANLLWASLVFWMVVIGAFFAALTLGKNEKMMANFVYILFYFEKMIVTTLGLFVGVLSPALGVGIIYLYLTLRDKEEGSWTYRLIKNFL